MAGSSCEGEQSTRNAYERTIARFGLSKRLRFFRDNRQNPEHFDRSEKDMGQKTTEAMVQANMTAWLYEYAKKHMSKHSSVYSAYQLDIGAGAFKRAFVIHRNAVTTAVKRTSRTSECDGREREEMLKEELERNVTLCLHNSFCRNRETNIDPLPCFKQRIEGHKCWRTASNSVRKATVALQETKTESVESMSQEEGMET